MEQKAFMIYKRYWKQIQRMSKEQAGELLQAIFAYACDGDVVEFDDFAVEVLFGVIRDDLDMNEEKYTEVSNKRAEAGKKGAETRWQKAEKPIAKDSKNSKCHICHDDEMANDGKHSYTDTDKDTDILKEKEYTSYIPKRKDDKFVPPTIEDVANYAKEKGYAGFNADNFVAFYQSKGWMVGKNKMKDWKSAVTGWHTREKNKPPANVVAPKFSPAKFKSDDRDLSFLEM